MFTRDRIVRFAPKGDIRQRYARHSLKCGRCGHPGPATWWFGVVARAAPISNPPDNSEEAEDRGWLSALSEAKTECFTGAEHLSQIVIEWFGSWFRTVLTERQVSGRWLFLSVDSPTELGCP
jgi:hypothetical protein